MTEAYQRKKQLKKLYQTNSTVMVDSLSHEQYKKGESETIDHCVNEIWKEEKPLRPNYQFYSDGMNPNKLQDYVTAGKISEEHLRIYREYERLKNVE